MSRAIVKVLASGFGFGFAPFAPGTFGTLPALPLAFALHFLPPWIFTLTLAAFTLAGTLICQDATKASPEKDPGWVVFDEIVGFLWATAFLPPTPASYAAAFFLFRVFDIIKPWPAGFIDKKVKGGWGIVLDDVAAGIYARFLLWLALCAKLS